MSAFTDASFCPSSRHPHILYWFWQPAILTGKKYLRDLDRVAADTPFTTVILSARDGMDFWKPELKPALAEAVAYAHELGLKFVLQLWPQGFLEPAVDEVPLDEAAAVVNEGEFTLRGGTVYTDDARRVCEVGDPMINHGKFTYTDDARRVEKIRTCPAIHSEFLRAYGFCKAGDGTYVPGTLRDLTDRVTVTEARPGHLSVCFDLPDEELTVYVLTAHYFRYGDQFGDFHIRTYGDFIDRYADVPFDGVVLDEMKNIEFEMSPVFLGERHYGRHFREVFEKTTGTDCLTTLFEMRYCAVGDDKTRVAAINRYYDVQRLCTRRLERFVAEKSRAVYGPHAFLGLHNTFHNHLQNDELQSTGINWWEVSRDYAQTDEDITYPVRMGIACLCPEALIYDMYYGKQIPPFREKAVRDARFGCRLHYHAMNDGYWGVDIGSSAFIEAIAPIEKKVELLNRFDPALPFMDLLVVFGFPALCNWYPDADARTSTDLNGALNIEERVTTLWEAGYHNALVSSDLCEDGRITLTEDGGFLVGGHRFGHLLFLYPQYGKEPTFGFLEKAIKSGASVAVIGDATADFAGDPIAPERAALLARVTVREDADIPALFGLRKEPLESGCTLEDGSGVFSDLSSIDTHTPARFRFEKDGHLWEGLYEGACAIKTEGDALVRFVAGGCRALTCDGETLFSDPDGRDIQYL